MQLGRFFGMMSIFFGGFITTLLYKTLQDGTYLKFTLAGPALVMIGIAMLFFPGGNITVNESKQKIKEPKTVFSDAPTRDKIIWAVAGVIGVVVAINFVGL